MGKKLFFLLLSVFCISIPSYAIDGWIRINQLGYLPNASKRAVFISESPVQLNEFVICDALTNEEIETFTTITDKGAFQSFKNTYILDFSSFKLQGAFYLKAGLIYSPTVYINKNVYLGTADILLNFLRHQRYQNSTPLEIFIPKEDPKPEPVKSSSLNTKQKATTQTAVVRPTRKQSETEEKSSPPQTKTLFATGGWYEAGSKNQYSAITAQTTYSLLMAYQLCPLSFTDQFDQQGNPVPNKIPDVLDEAKNGLNWLLHTFPSTDSLFFQLSEKTEKSNEPILFLAGQKYGKQNEADTYLRGIASVAGKYASALGLGAEIFSSINPRFADTLKLKAIGAFRLGQKYPGICRTESSLSSNAMEEDNWSDDMEMAAAQLYRLTYDGQYVRLAASYGRMEPISPWMCSDTARNYQWYPYFNAGHYQLANVENPRFKKEFLSNMQNGIQRMSSYAAANPFSAGVPMVRNSNSMAVALATQCRIYRNLTSDSTYFNMENAVVEWLLGRNPWGVSMISGLPSWGNTSGNYYSTTGVQKTYGAMVNGPVMSSSFAAAKNPNLPTKDPLERFQSSMAVYHNDKNDYETNQPAMDGTAALTYLLASLQQEGVPGKTTDQNLYVAGGITRTDPSKKNISLVFTAHDMTDGYKIIRSTLQRQNVKASFFFTGDFFRRRKFSGIVKDLIKDGHYVGANSDKNTVYCSWRNRDSVLLDKTAFMEDIRNNYQAMAKFGIRRDETPFFVAPYDTYNDSISKWCHEIGLHLISSTPGVLSGTDNSTPEMREKYYSSNEIFNKVLQAEKSSGLNGYILVYHLGSDKRREDKFYPRLISLIMELKKAGYQFTDLYQSTDVVDRYKADPNQKKKKQKRKD